MTFMLPLLPMLGGAAGAGSGMALAAAGVAAAGTLMEGIASSQQAGFESKMAGMNAAIERDNAARVRLEGATAEEAQRRAARKALGDTAAALAQSGGAGGGSDYAIIRQSATEAELDALNIRYAHESRAGMHLTQAAAFDVERQAAKSRGKNAIAGSVLKAGGQLLSGISDYGTAKAAGRVRTTQVSMSRPSTRAGAAKPRSYPKGG